MPYGGDAAVVLLPSLLLCFLVSLVASCVFAILL